MEVGKDVECFSGDAGALDVTAARVNTRILPVTVYNIGTFDALRLDGKN